MSRSTILSSEQALKEYFSDLLDESTDESVTPELEIVQEIEPEVVDEVSKPEEVVPQLMQAPVQSYSLPQREELVAPKLDDIQRLLDSLEASDPVGELGDIEALIEKNTLNLHTPTEEVVEEIQEWDTETLDVADIKVEEEIEPEVPVVEPLVQVEEEVKPEVAQPIYHDPEPVETVVPEHEVHTSVSSSGGGSVNDIDWSSTERNESFQVLFFDVYGVTFAVPLDELGGIHRLEKTSHLIGRPDWYLGLQTNRENQLDVVDTAKWVMSEKLADDSYKDTYQYIVMLGESFWGLACGELKGTELIAPNEVRWRETAGKRPWLAGMVKEKMCALIHVEALIRMLNAGQDVKALDK